MWSLVLLITFHYPYFWSFSQILSNKSFRFRKKIRKVGGLTLYELTNLRTDIWSLDKTLGVEWSDRAAFKKNNQL